MKPERSERALTATLLTASFIEGGAVMVIELASARAVAPYYGTSLYAWGAVLGVAIGALATGYWAGGRLSRSYPAGPPLVGALLLGGLLAALGPNILALAAPYTDALGVQLGAVTTVACTLLGPLICMGAVSPLVIHLINREVTGTGNATGTVYAVSTTGGILATFLAGFYLLPEIGIRRTAWGTGGLLALTGLACLVALNLIAPSRALPPPDGPATNPGPRRRTRKAGEKAALPLPGRALARGLLLTVAGIEGGAVMIMELLGARITAPYYGASLSVWSSVLAVTLAALALGYFLGGRLSQRYRSESVVFVALLIGALLITAAPLVAPPILLATDALGVRAGSLVACLVYLLPPVTCLGMVSPLITQRASRSREDSGQSAGSVYAVSTVGGIVATFFAGFYLIPQAGIVTTALLTGGLLAATSAAYFLLAERRFVPAATAAAIIAMAASLRPDTTSTADTNVVYRSSGILGEWTVLDSGAWEELKKGVAVERRLMLNGIDQTFTQRGFEPLSLWRYPHKIAAYASMKPAGSRALLLGMGGGSIAYELKAMGFDLDIVELDARIPQIVEQYFRFDPVSARVFIDDARHFLRTGNDRYDVVVIDLLIGEVQPTHVFSMEGFADLRKRLKDDALVIINFQGFMNDGASSLAPRSIYKTLQAAGFFTRYYAAPGDDNMTDDIFFLASPLEQDYRELMRDLRYNRWFTYDHFGYDDLVREGAPRLDDAFVLVDDQPRLEVLNAQNILQWRQVKMNENLRPLLHGGLPIYR